MTNQTLKRMLTLDLGAMIPINTLFSAGKKRKLQENSFVRWVSRHRKNFYYNKKSSLTSANKPSLTPSNPFYQKPSPVENPPNAKPSKQCSGRPKNTTKITTSLQLKTSKNTRNLRNTRFLQSKKISLALNNKSKLWIFSSSRRCRNKWERLEQCSQARLRQLTQSSIAILKVKRTIPAQSIWLCPFTQKASHLVGKHAITSWEKVRTKEENLTVHHPIRKWTKIFKFLSNPFVPI